MYLRRVGIVAVLTALSLLVVGLGAAGAHKASFPTRVVIEKGGPEGASGHVSSKRSQCLGGREVSLYIKDPASGKLLLVGATVTDGDGNWSIEAELFEGQYVAKVTADKTTVHGESHRCKRGRSGTKRL
jgi:hypothetical protein